MLVRAGAKVQVQLEQPQRDRLSEIPTAAPLTPTDTLQEFFQYRGLRSASDTQPPAASTSASDSETETTCLSSIDSADESAVGMPPLSPPRSPPCHLPSPPPAPHPLPVFDRAEQDDRHAELTRVYRVHTPALCLDQRIIVIHCCVSKCLGAAQMHLRLTELPLAMKAKPHPYPLQ